MVFLFSKRRFITFLIFGAYNDLQPFVEKLNAAYFCNPWTVDTGGKHVQT